MRRALAVAVCGLVGTGSPAPAEDSRPGPAARITYVANEGFLVIVGDSGVLVDGLFAPGPLDWADVPSADTRRRLETGAPPFDRVTVALVTHRHHDHFEPGLAVALLRSRPGASLVGPPQVVERLEAVPDFDSVASRVHAARADPGSDETRAFGDVTVRALGIPHSPYMVRDEATGQMVNRHRNTENLGYWVDVGGFTFFHNGDAGLTAAAEYCRFDLPSAGVDVAFLGGVFWGPTEPTLETVRRCLAPGHVVPMHLHPDERTTLAGRIEALDGPHPPFVVPGSPMTEIILP